MTSEYTSLGLMSGTSGDGVDASIIKSDGETQYKVILNKYFKYDKDIYKDIHKIKDNLNNYKDLETLSEEIKKLEKKITLFHAEVVNNSANNNVDFVGFHGQTIFHNPEKKISVQLGDGKLLSELTKKKVVYNFRQNDLKNGGEGAPLTPIFHKLLVNQKKINLPVTILNIGGIANVTSIDKDNKIFSYDIGPGSCLIDKWIRINSDKTFDSEGKIARSGSINKIILDQSLDNFYNNDVSKKRSYDTKDFDLSFVKGLSLEDGAATLTEFTAQIFSKKNLYKNIYVCGGGRKNKFLIENIEKVIKNTIKLIDDLEIDGDFVESQAFAYLAIRSCLNLPITFPETTGVKKSCIGGKIIETK
jgi:anhydro-N-acetylmuramic acid kinase